MSLERYAGYVGFLEQKDLNRVARKGKWRNERLPRKRWVMLGKVPSGFIEVEERMRGVIIATAGVLEMEVEAFEKAVVRHVAAMKRVGGILCLDCVLVHPGAYAEAVGRVYRGWVRKNKKREEHLSTLLPPKRNINKV